MLNTTTDTITYAASPAGLQGLNSISSFLPVIGLVLFLAVVLAVVSITVSAIWFQRLHNFLRALARSARYALIGILTTGGLAVTSLLTHWLLRNPAGHATARYAGYVVLAYIASSFVGFIVDRWYRVIKQKWQHAKRARGKK